MVIFLLDLGCTLPLRTIRHAHSMGMTTVLLFKAVVKRPILDQLVIEQMGVLTDAGLIAFLPGCRRDLLGDNV